MNCYKLLADNWVKSGLIFRHGAKTSPEVIDEGQEQQHLHIKRQTRKGGGHRQQRGTDVKGDNIIVVLGHLPSSEKFWLQDAISSVGFEIWHQIPLIITIL